MFKFVAKNTPCFKMFALCYSAIGHSFYFPALILGSFALAFGEGNGTPLQYSCLENPMVEEPGGLQSMGSLRVRHD